MSVKQTQNGIELHIGSPDGTFIMDSGPYAGLRTKLVGRGLSVGASTPIRVVHAAPPIIARFDPAYAVSAQPAPDQAALDAAKPAAVVEVATVEEEIVTETFTSSTPTEANPFADIQTVSFDEETPVELAQPETDAQDGAETLSSNHEAGTPLDMLTILQGRDLRKASISNMEFNALGLSKSQTFKVYEQVIGRTTNRPPVQQAAQAILVKANANAADYTRVVQALARVLGA